MSHPSGAVTLTSVLFCLAVCADVAIQYGYDHGIESTIIAPPMTAQPTAIGGKVTVKLTALAQTVATPCSYFSGTTSGYAQGSWRLTSKEDYQETNQSAVDYNRLIISGQAPPGPLVPTVNHYCAFTITTDALAVTSPHFSTDAATAAGNTVGNALFTIGSELQIVSWRVTVTDGKAEASTIAEPAALVPTNIAYQYQWQANSTNGADTITSSVRNHILSTRLIPAIFNDRSFFDSAGVVTSYGHKASFLAYSVVDATVANYGYGDSFQLSLARADLVSQTTKVPRFSVLALIGIVCGLAIGVSGMMKMVYEYSLLCCYCDRIQKARVKARYWHGQKVDIAPSLHSITSQPKTLAQLALSAGIAPELIEHLSRQAHGAGHGNIPLRTAPDTPPPLLSVIGEEDALSDPGTSTRELDLENGLVRRLTPNKPAGTKRHAMFREPSVRLVAYAPSGIGGASSSGASPSGSTSPSGSFTDRSTKNHASAFGGSGAVGGIDISPASGGARASIASMDRELTSIESRTNNRQGNLVGGGSGSAGIASRILSRLASVRPPSMPAGGGNRTSLATNPAFSHAHAVEARQAGAQVDLPVGFGLLHQGSSLDVIVTGNNAMNSHQAHSGADAHLQVASSRQPQVSSLIPASAASATAAAEAAVAKYLGFSAGSGAARPQPSNATGAAQLQGTTAAFITPGNPQLGASFSGSGRFLIGSKKRASINAGSATGTGAGVKK